jgi:hypothetical protein
VLGLDIGAGRGGSSPMSAIVLSTRHAAEARRDDLIALLLHGLSRESRGGQ